MSERRRLRPSPIAGKWYPGDARQLAESVDAMLARARPAAPAGALVGLVAPHAGHRYSGPVAAAAFRLLQGSAWDLIVLLGPSHRVPTGAGVLVADADAYVTPLGPAPIATELVAAMGRSFPVRMLSDDVEHSLEIELPFLQRALDSLPPLLPLMTGAPSLETARRLAQALLPLLQGRRALLVASSDWSHYHPDQLARELDQAGLELLLRLDSAGLAAAFEQGQTQACGAGALLACLELARLLGADQATLLDYATSGDVSGDRASVVGYAALALLRGGEEGQGDGC
jgi:AmmeMemoRadiSam system protein B